MKVVGITSCPSGVAHTYMAAEALKLSGEKLGKMCIRDRAMAVDPYVRGFAVATVEEGVILRRHGIGKMILVLGVTHPDQYGELIRYQIRPTVFTLRQAERLSEPVSYTHLCTRSISTNRTLWTWA